MKKSLKESLEDFLKIFLDECAKIFIPQDTVYELKPKHSTIQDK